MVRKSKDLDRQIAKLQDAVDLMKKNMRALGIPDEEIEAGFGASTSGLSAFFGSIFYVDSSLMREAQRLHRQKYSRREVKKMIDEIERGKSILESMQIMIDDMYDHYEKAFDQWKSIRATPPKKK